MIKKQQLNSSLGTVQLGDFKQFSVVWECMYD